MTIIPIPNVNKHIIISSIQLSDKQFKIGSTSILEKNRSRN